MASSMTRVVSALALVVLGTACAGGTAPGASGDEGNCSFTPCSGGDDTPTGGGTASESQSGPDDGSGSNSASADETADDEGNDEAACMDADGDGYGDGCGQGEDCDDDDPDVNPSAPELCDAVDQNCDGDPMAGCECPDDGVSGNCNMPTDIGVINVGEVKPGVVGNVPQENALDWYKVSFPAAARPGEGTPTIEFAINEDDAFVFDVVLGQCEATGATCTTGGTGGAAIGLTTWTFVDDQPGCCTPPMDSMVAWPNDLHLRVYRTTTGQSCSAYQLQFSR
jgi:hypothetical protein